MRRTLARRATDPERFTAHRLATLDFATFREEYGDAFAPGVNLRIRHRLFSDTAGVLDSGHPLRLAALLHEPVWLGRRGGLYDRLRAIPAFAGDPEAKKARILVQELSRSGLITPLDQEAVRPAIEYHLIRLYLRTERVLPQRRDDEARLQDEPVFRAPIIMRIRRAVEEAMYFTAAAAEMPIATLNHIEWQIARSFCDRDTPRCAGPPLQHKPCDETVTALADGQGCPYSNVCLGAEDHRTMRVIEPRLSPRYHYY